jgi:hypothetical protein
MMDEDTGEEMTRPEDNFHVYPMKGPRHEMSVNCWCEPERDLIQPHVWIHRSVH